MKYKGELIAVAVIVVFASIFLVMNAGGAYEWGGADGEAEGVIGEITEGEYEPWFASIYEPPSGEIESLFFSLQAAIGAGIIGYFFGFYRGRRQNA